METIDLACSCGLLRGKLEGVVPGHGERYVCLCDDCQAYANYLGQGKKVLDPQGGTEVYAATPAQIKFTSGIENLKCLRLTEKGVLRWYAGCCKTPVANTPPKPGIPYAGVVRIFLDDHGQPEVLNKTLGPIHGRVLARFGKPPFAENTYQGTPLFIGFRIFKFLIRGYLKGLKKPTPFFKEGTNEPRVVPYVLTHVEREKLRRPAEGGEFVHA